MLDLGTNTVLASVLFADPREPRRLRVAEELQFVTGLGRDRRSDGGLSEAGQRRAWSALSHVARRLDVLSVPSTAIRGAATAACREAPNGPAFLTRIRGGLGLPFAVISGEEEARLVGLAQARSFPDRLPAVAIDIGGGSTEIVHVGRRGALLWSRSIPLGATKLAAALGPRPERSEVERLIAAALAPEALPRLGLPVIGVAGTVTSAQQVIDGSDLWDPVALHSRELSRDAIVQLAIEMLGRTPEERARMRSVHPLRADALGPALLWLDALLDRLGADGVITSDRGVRYGLLYDAWPGVMVRG